MGATGLNLGGSHTPCLGPSCFVMSLGGASDGLELVSDAGQFIGEIGGIRWLNRLRGCDAPSVVGPAMLPDVFVGFAKPAIDVSRDFGEQGDDAARVAPAAKDDQR